MITGLKASYSPAYYIVLEGLIWRYDGKCVDTCKDKGRLRTEAEFTALYERIRQNKASFTMKYLEPKVARMHSEEKK